MNRFLVVASLLVWLSSCGSPETVSSMPPDPDATETPAPMATETVTATAPPLPAPSPLPGLYHRIYQGYSHAKLKPAAFVKILNAKFFPLFPKAEKSGLLAYRPALPKNPKACALPAEVALLTFKNEKDYARYRDSKIGKKIRAAHAPVFRSDTSKSLVPEALSDTIHFDHAYSLNPGPHDYRKSHSVLVIHCNPALTSEELRIALVKAYATRSDATDILFTAAPDHVLEYVFFPKSSDAAARIAERKARFQGLFLNSTVVSLPKRKLGKKKVGIGQGIDVQW